MDDSVEVHFAQKLASNDKKYRDKALKRLRKYLNVRSSHGDGFSHDDFIKIWKGLHYSMWMQDKPLIQEDLSQRMSGLLHAFPKLDDSMRFVNAFFITEAREWSGLDHFRLDKFMMLIRGILHEAFALLSEGWPLAACQSFAHCLTESVMNESNTKIPYGLKMHIVDIFIIEMRKVSLQGIDAKKLTILMVPFIYFVLKTKRQELARTAHEKTVQHVLAVFGKWSWKDKKRRERNKMAARPKRKNVEDSEEEEGEEGSDEELMEAEDSSDEEQMEEVEDMDVDEDAAAKKPKLEFDLCLMLSLMRRLAEDPKVKGHNRSYLYGIVNTYTSRDTNVLSRVLDFARDDDVESVITNISELIWEPENETKKKKKKGKRPEDDEDKTSVKDTNEVKSSKNSLTVAVVEKSTKEIREGGKKAKAVEQDLEEEESEQFTPTKIKKKKRKRTSDAGESPVKKVKIDSGGGNEDVTTSPLTQDGGKDSNKKQKKGSSDKVKGSPMSSPSNSLPMKKKKKSKSSCESNSTLTDINSNSNALSPPKNIKSFSAPMECVIYPQKSPKPVSVSKFKKPPKSPKSPKRSSPAGTSPKTSSPAAAKYCLTDSSPPRSAKSADSQSNESVQKENISVENQASGGSSVGSLTNTLYSTFKKAVGFGEPSATEQVSPGVKTPLTPNESLTPGSQKKVVFDLRKNKANKFKDYLKSLAADDISPFEPSKSPSQGILKSPSTSSTSLSSDLQDNETKKPKRKLGSPKTTRPKSPKQTRKSLSPGNKRKLKYRKKSL